MKQPRLSYLALIVAAFFILLAVSVYLYIQTRAINVQLQNEIVPALRELKTLDAEWDANILKSHVGINSNYDPLTTPLRKAHALRARLLRSVEVTEGGTLETALHAMESAFVDKEELVEQFKLQNAVLRNSLRYFPTAVEELKSLLPAQSGETGPSARLAGTVERLLADLLRFNLMPETAQAERIAADINDIEGRQGAYPVALRDSLALLIRHARLILRQRTVEDAVMQRIAATPTASAIDGLSNALEQEFLRVLHEGQQYRTYLFTYSGVLLLLLGYAAWWLVRSYQLIAQVNKRLQAANETLEQRVVERTAALERQSARLAELARHDTLTGLINRRELMTQLAQALQRAERREWVVALLFIDLDGFKEINDTLGHAAGDQVLKEAAARIKRHVRRDDVMARLGGDEFVILLNEVGTPDGVIRVAEAALRELREFTEVNGHAIYLSASVGISSVRGGGSNASPEALLSLADHAMYQAKQQGKDRYRFSTPNAWQAA
jgi:diguanylate cyclase (GGDEF)-like protein